jgi:hypothetical protein
MSCVVKSQKKGAANKYEELNFPSATKRLLVFYKIYCLAQHFWQSGQTHARGAVKIWPDF